MIMVSMIDFGVVQNVIWHARVGEWSVLIALEISANSCC